MIISQCEMHNDNWQSVFLAEVTIDREKEAGEEDSDDEIEGDSADQEVLSHIKSYKEAIVVLGTLFFYNTEEAMALAQQLVLSASVVMLQQLKPL